jgi:hypothetical protein
MGLADFDGAADHEAASQFVGQARLATKYSAGKCAEPLSTSCGQFGSMAETVQAFAGKPMKKLILAILLIASPAWAQTKLVPKNATARADPCAPIGRTADGKLVYSLKCENLPVPPPPPQAEIAPPPPPPEPEIHRSGIFGWSYETKRPDQ